MEIKKNVVYYANQALFLVWSAYMLLNGIGVYSREFDIKMIFTLLGLLAVTAIMAVIFEKVISMDMLAGNKAAKCAVEAVLVFVLLAVSFLIRVNLMKEYDIIIYKEVSVIICVLLAYGTARLFSGFGVFSILLMIFWPTLISRYSFSLEAIVSIVEIYAAVFVAALIFYMARNVSISRPLGISIFIVIVAGVVVFEIITAGKPPVVGNFIDVFVNFEESFSFTGLENYYYLSCLCLALAGALRMWFGKGSLNCLIVYILNVMLMMITCYGFGSEYTYLMIPFLGIIASGIFGINRVESIVESSFDLKEYAGTGGDAPGATAAVSGNDLPDIITEANFDDFIKNQNSSEGGMKYSEVNSKENISEEKEEKADDSVTTEFTGSSSEDDDSAAGSWLFTQAPGEGIVDYNVINKDKKSEFFDFEFDAQDSSDEKVVKNESVREAIDSDTSDEDIFVFLSEDPAELEVSEDFTENISESITNDEDKHTKVDDIEDIKQIVLPDIEDVISDMDSDVSEESMEEVLPDESEETAGESETEDIERNIEEVLPDESEETEERISEEVTDKVIEEAETENIGENVEEIFTDNAEKYDISESKYVSVNDEIEELAEDIDESDIIYVDNYVDDDIEIEDILDEIPEISFEDIVEEPIIESVSEEAEEKFIEEVSAVEADIIESTVEETEKSVSEEVFEDITEPIETESGEIEEEKENQSIEGFVYSNSEMAEEQPITEEPAEEVMEESDIEEVSAVEAGIIESTVEETEKSVSEEVFEDITEPIDTEFIDEPPITEETKEEVMEWPSIEEEPVIETAEYEPSTEEPEKEDEYPSFNGFGVEDLVIEEPPVIIKNDKKTSFEEAAVTDEQRTDTIKSSYSFEPIDVAPDISIVAGEDFKNAVPVIEPVIAEEVKEIPHERVIVDFDEAPPVNKKRYPYDDDDDDEFNFPSFNNMFGMDGFDYTTQQNKEPEKEENVDIDEAFPSFHGGDTPVNAESALGDPYFDWSKVDAANYFIDGEEDRNDMPAETKKHKAEQEFEWTPEMIAALDREK